ncbi:uncharacterized protein LOC142350823 isoform X2 [Convolutriloba macropyga]
MVIVSTVAMPVDRANTNQEKKIYCAKQIAALNKTWEQLDVQKSSGSVFVDEKYKDRSCGDFAEDVKNNPKEFLKVGGCVYKRETVPINQALLASSSLFKDENKSVSSLRFYKLMCQKKILTDTSYPGLSVAQTGQCIVNYKMIQLSLESPECYGITDNIMWPTVP